MHTNLKNDEFTFARHEVTQWRKGAFVQAFFCCFFCPLSLMFFRLWISRKLYPYCSFNVLYFEISCCLCILQQKSINFTSFLPSAGVCIFDKMSKVCQINYYKLCFSLCCFDGLRTVRVQTICFF